jgi:hypothetical protein
MEYLVSTNLSILNKGNEPSFVFSNRKDIIDLAIGTENLREVVTNRHVSDEISLSHHTYIQGLFKKYPTLGREKKVLYLGG